MLHLHNYDFSIRRVALALEQPQATADHSEKVVDVVDDELRHVLDCPRVPRLAGDQRAAHVERWHELAQHPGDLAVAVDQRNFHPPGRDTDTAGAVGSHLRAERVFRKEWRRLKFDAPMAGQTPIGALLPVTDKRLAPVCAVEDEC